MVDPKKYLVLDVETNGLNPTKDDLLSISIYKPDDGKAFDRFLPLEKQSKLDPKATAVNGIRRGDLRGKKPLDQGEVDSLIEGFGLRERTILTYGGARGASGRGFDERFLRQYFDDHGLVGVDKLHFFDFKRLIHSGRSTSFPVTKDNLCRAFGIGGVSSTHTSKNDCMLEWKLFEAMDGQHLLVTEGNVFKLNHGYVVPASYLDSFSGLREYAGVPKRYVEAQKVFALELSEGATREFVRFPNNISGVTVEHLIDSEVQARQVDARKRLLRNKSKLEYVGSFPGASEPIPVELGDDGLAYLSSATLEHAAQSVRNEMGSCALADALDLTRKRGGSFLEQLKASYEAMKEFLEICSSQKDVELGLELRRIAWQSEVVEAAARADRAIRPELKPLVEFLKALLGPGIMAQELVMNQSEGCLALCDLSSEKAAVEIKTGGQGYDLSKCVNQLYYQANGRDCYALHVEWGERTSEGLSRTKFIVEKVSFTTERPKTHRRMSEKARRRYAIRHAVTEWRYSHPEGGPKGCAKALWLEDAEVNDAWPKADPGVMFEVVPSRGKKRLNFDRMVSWREAHPGGTRLELASDEGIPVSDVERWWYQAAMPAYGGKGDAIPAKMDDESVRATIGEYADESCLYSTWTDEEVVALREQVRGLCRRTGVPVAGEYSLFFWPREHYSPEWRKDLVPLLKSLGEKCEKELRSGAKVLRIPLHMTRYKTRTSYMALDPQKASVTWRGDPGNGGECVVVIVSNRETAMLKPGDELYAAAGELVGKRVERVYIERSDEDEEGQVVLVALDAPALPRTGA